MLLGHESILADLKSLADRDALSHAYLFHGPAMVGKKMAALALARHLEIRPETLRPAGAPLMDCRLIEPGENGSIGIDAVREISHFLWQKPNVSPRRTLIIDDAERLTAEAQNALLRIAEEPPASSLLILVTSDPESLAPTIQSRFQKIYFGLVGARDQGPGRLGEPRFAGTGNRETARKSFGKPGLVWRLEHDKEFQEQISRAEQFLKSSPATRRDFIKKLIEPEDFSLNKFLDAVIMVLAWEMEWGTRDMGHGTRDKGLLNLWHATLALRDRQASFSLNPRLQLESLLVV